MNRFTESIHSTIDLCQSLGKGQLEGSTALQPRRRPRQSRPSSGRCGHEEQTDRTDVTAEVLGTPTIAPRVRRRSGARLGEPCFELLELIDTASSVRPPVGSGVTGGDVLEAAAPLPEQRRQRRLG
jgi:hypothetical protein